VEELVSTADPTFMGDVLHLYGPIGFGLVVIVVLLKYLIHVWSKIVQPNIDAAQAQSNDLVTVSDNLVKITHSQEGITHSQEKTAERMETLVDRLERKMNNEK
jgi:uncharacterized membrane protein YeiB